MKLCPTCGAARGDDEVVCEADGTALASPSAPAIARASAVTLAPKAAACSACGAPIVGGGRCAECGYDVRAEQPTLPVVPLSAILGVCDIVGARGAEDFILRGDRGEMTLALGEAGALVGEAKALQALGGLGPFPALVDSGSAAEGGSYVAMEAPPVDARRLRDVVPSFDVRDVLRLARGVLDVAARIEGVGYGWHPDPTDVWICADGSVALSRVRGATKLAGARLDARQVLEAFGPELIPEPLVRGVPRLFHMLVPNVDAPSARDVDALGAEIDAIAIELDTPFDAAPVAAAGDPGLRRDHNEDASALAAGETSERAWAALVVCDGVSASAHAEQASDIAATTTRDALVELARRADLSPEATARAMADAISLAHLAICASYTDGDRENAPGTTLVAAFVAGNRLTYGWIGDSRLYWVSSAGGELLTQDHSWAGEAVARGEMTSAEAMRAPLAHALTRCLGPIEEDESSVLPDVRVRDLTTPGHLVLCTDGFWNYFPDASAVAALVAEAGQGAPSALIARRLVNHALARGGHDNITVAVHAFSP